MAASAPEPHGDTKNGDIAIGAATVAPTSVVVDLLATLPRPRQAEFAARAGYREPDAWDTGAEEPGVPIDIHTQLTEKQYESAWQRWRIQWQERVPLTEEQQKQKETLSLSDFNRK